MNAWVRIWLLASWLVPVPFCPAQQPAPLSSTGPPALLRKPGELKFKQTSFTFVRVQYDVTGAHGLGSTPERWKIDYPESDRKLAARFAQVTGLKPEPEPKAMRLTDAKLKQHPFLYLVEPGRLSFSEAEVSALRAYLLGGGYLMADDF